MLSLEWPILKNIYNIVLDIIMCIEILPLRTEKFNLYSEYLPNYQNKSTHSLPERRITQLNFAAAYWRKIQQTILISIEHTMKMYKDLYIDRVPHFYSQLKTYLSY